MSGETITQTVTLVVEICCNSSCGIMFAVPLTWQKQRRQDHTWFTCPNGHSQHYPDKSDLEKAREELEQERTRRLNAQSNATHERQQRRTAERSRDAYKGVVTRTKKRIGNGICPCCSRHFANLERHMKAKHPTYGGDAT